MSDEGKVSLERRDSVAVITIDHPPVNALSPTVFKELAERFAEAGADPEIDIATVMEFGFPPWRGGIMYYAKQIRYKKVYDTLAKYADQYGG